MASAGEKSLAVCHIPGFQIDPTREIGGFFVCIKFFQEILKKHPQKTLSHFKQMKGLIPNHEKVSPFTCILTTE